MVLVNDLRIKECDILFPIFPVTIHLFDYVKLVLIESTITQILLQQLKEHLPFFLSFMNGKIQGFVHLHISPLFNYSNIIVMNFKKSYNGFSIRTSNYAHRYCCMFGNQLVVIID
jgi:hypothetical protein